MEHIKTTALAVSKLKKKAKLLVRDQGLQHVEALERVAIAAGYANWKHVQTCAEAPDAGPALATVTALELRTDGFAGAASRDVRPQLTLVTGRSGTGKTILALDKVLNTLREGHSATVLDVGRQYLHAARLIGGSAFDVQLDGTLVATNEGGDEFHVYDFEACLRGKLTAGLGWLDARVAGPGALLVIDEGWSVDRIISDSAGLVNRALSAGCSVIVTAQTAEEFSGFLAAEAPRGTRRIHVDMKLPSAQMMQREAA